MKTTKAPSIVSDHPQHSRRIAYFLGAGFSYGTGHKVPMGRHSIEMPIQHTLFEQLSRFHYKKSKRLDRIATIIRRYFCPSTFLPKHTGGSSRHKDLFGLSLEEVVTFMDEAIRRSSGGDTTMKRAMVELQELIVGLISHLSTNGNPGKNKLLKKFLDRILTTDIIVTFNWDTLLDRCLFNHRKLHWHPAWGYGRVVRETFRYQSEGKYVQPKKHPLLLKLHGSINWTAHGWNTENPMADRWVPEAGHIPVQLISKSWGPDDRLQEVVMMPPKMVKQEVYGDIPMNGNISEYFGNDAVGGGFYRSLWEEAEERLSNVKRIVFIGYSFPPADFAVTNLLRRILSRIKKTQNRSPEIDIVDPNVDELSSRFQKSFGIEVPLDSRFLSLTNYIAVDRPSKNLTAS